jgi:hypothetical protein
MTGVCSAKATHSSQYQIPIKLNQQPLSGKLQHEENNSLIEPSTFVLRATADDPNGTSFQTFGNQTFDNHGNSWPHYGNQTFGTNGTSCQRVGNQLFCN